MIDQDNWFATNTEKPAQTKWEKIEVRNNQTLVYFYPITVEHINYEDAHTN